MGDPMEFTRLVSTRTKQRTLPKPGPAEVRTSRCGPRLGLQSTKRFEPYSPLLGHISIKARALS